MINWLVDGLQKGLGVVSRSRGVCAIVGEHFGENFWAKSDKSQEEKAQFDPIESPLFASASGDGCHEVGLLFKDIGT